MSAQAHIYRNLTPQLIGNPAQLSNYPLLAEKYGDKQVPLTVLQEHGYSAPPFQKKTVLFGEYLSPAVSAQSSASHAHHSVTSHSSPAYYLQQCNLQEHFPELIKEAQIAYHGPYLLMESSYLKTSCLIKPEFCSNPTYFIGLAGTKTSLHFDRSGAFSHRVPTSKTSTQNYNSTTQPVSASNPLSTATNGGKSPSSSFYDPGKYNLLLQVSGKRKVVMFAPEYTPHLYPPEPGHSASYNSFSREDASLILFPNVSACTTFVHTIEPDGRTKLEEQLQYITQGPFPSLAEAWPHRKEYVLVDGDALLIPPRWWYYSEVLETGSAINWWFLTDHEIEIIREQLSCDEINEVYHTHINNIRSSARDGEDENEPDDDEDKSSSCVIM